MICIVGGSQELYTTKTMSTSTVAPRQSNKSVISLTELSSDVVREASLVVGGVANFLLRLYLGST
jgi:hypothetical protein